MSEDENSQFIPLYIFLTFFLIGCGCHLYHKCLTNINFSHVSESESSIVEMDSITNALHSNSIISELEYLSVTPNMEKYSNEDECVICTEKMLDDQVRILKCSHHFHKSCIDEWISLSQKLECPICGLNLSQLEPDIV